MEQLITRGNTFGKLTYHLGPAPSEVSREVLLARCEQELARMNKVIELLGMSRSSGRKTSTKAGTPKKAPFKKQKAAASDETLRAIAEAAGMTLEQLKENL
jgi:LysM repeat protein